MSELQDKINKRRTFAIISHPDAGKTTLTEKLLLYGGAIHLAGSVKSRKTNRHAVSDWMEIENREGFLLQAACSNLIMMGTALISLIHRAIKISVKILIEP